MNLLLLTRYGSLGASSRLRMLQFIPSLQEAGINVEVTPFFDNSYLFELYADQRSPTKILSYYASRSRKLLWDQKPDAIWLEKESFPWLPFALERALMPAGIPVVSDYDDAVFHRYDQHDSSIVRQVLGNKIDKVMANSRIVTAGNPYLAERALKAGAAELKLFRRWSTSIPTLLFRNHPMIVVCGLVGLEHRVRGGITERRWFLC